MGDAKAPLMPERRQQPQLATSEQPARMFERQFASGELDLDDLAEAVRLLLNEGPPARNLRLLSPPTRATHVMEAET